MKADARGGWWVVVSRAPGVGAVRRTAVFADPAAATFGAAP